MDEVDDEVQEADEQEDKKKEKKKAMKQKNQKKVLEEEEVEETEEHQALATIDDINSDAKPCKDVFKVYVGEIPFSWDRDILRKHFSECGEIDWMHMPQDALGRPTGFAFISYWDQASVDAALELDGRYFGGRKLKVNMASDKPAKLPKEKDIFISGLPFSCTEDILRKDFSECGVITRLNMPVREDGSSKGIAFISYKKAQAVADALKFNGTEYGGRKLTVRLSSEKPEPRSIPAGSDKENIDNAGCMKSKKALPEGKEESEARAESTEPHPFEVIVKGLGFKTKEDSLREELQECGEIESVRMPMNKRKRNSLGYAFVAFQNKKGLKRALKLNGTEIGGREVRVERLLQKSAGEETSVAEEPAAVVEGPPLVEAEPPRKKRKLAAESGAAADASGAADVEPVKKRRKQVEEEVEEEVADPTEEEILAKKIARKERRKAERLSGLVNQDAEVETLSKEEIIAKTKANREARKAKKLAARLSQ